MKNSATDKPALSVVIPTLGRPVLQRTVRSLTEAERSGELDVVIAGVIRDEMLLREIEKAGSVFFRLVILPVSFEKGDSSRKKNAGMEASLSDIVAFLDDDVIVDRAWPDKVLDVFRRPEVGLMSGPGLVPHDVPLMTRLAGAALASKASGYVSSRYLSDAQGEKDVKWSRLIGCNMAYRKNVLQAAGGFDASFWPGEEMLAAFRATKLGHKLVFYPGAHVYHYPRSSFSGFCRQIYGYGATRIRLIRSGVEIEPSTLLPGIWVFSLLLLGVGSLFFPALGYLLALNIVLYLLACLGITIDKVLETRKASHLPIFFLIPVMHVCYGAAEWIELFRPGRDLSEKPGADSPG